VISVLASQRPSHASAPMAQTQAPGFYRVMIGDLEVTPLNDGVVPYKTRDVLPTATDQQIQHFLSDNALTDPVGMSYNGFLINTGSKLILVDTGSGGKLEDDPSFHGTGRLMANLRAAGYRPEQVDEVFITHRGQDHVGGLTTRGVMAFPNAIVHAPRAEFDVVVDPDKQKALLERAHGSAFVKGWIKFAQDAFAPYIAAGRFQLFDGDASFPSGVHALATPGHTPGHTSYVIESRGERLILLGDLVLSPLQFIDPALGSRFDSKPADAAAQRVRILSDAAQSHAWVAGGHIPFPAIGHVLRDATGFRFVPPNYATELVIRPPVTP
jgi:glyoxylase-like metal-dependent hydrolase (beta-lactamase superfamily II)